MPHRWNKLAGRFVVLDGPDGCGKTTQLALLGDYLIGHDLTVEMVRDPGGTAVGEAIRKVLLDRDNVSISPICETMLFMASRAQLIQQRIRPALDAGKLVLCDRFVSATIAYQGASGVDAGGIVKLADLATGCTWPDLTIILDVPVEIGMQRAGAPRQQAGAGRRRPGQACLFGDRLEARGAAFHEAVRRNFLSLCEGKIYPAPVVKVDAAGDTQQVAEQVLLEIGRRLCPESDD